MEVLRRLFISPGLSSNAMAQGSSSKRALHWFGGSKRPPFKFAVTKFDLLSGYAEFAPLQSMN
jgi:hypothetical protein